MKATVAALSLALAPMLVPSGQASPTNSEAIRTVVVSANRVATESAEGKAVNQRLQQLAQRMSADISAREKDGKTTSEELLKLRQQSQTEFQNAQRQAQNELRAKVNPVILEVATQRKADLVLNGDAAVIWASPALDVTADVIAKLNAQAPK